MKGRYTMSTPYWNYGLNGFNSMDSLTNQYLQAALMAQNVNFKGDSSQVASADSAQAVSANNGGIPVVQTQTTQQEASVGSNFVTTALATAVIGGGALWMLKSGKFSQASKAIKSWMGKGESQSSTVLTSLRAIKNGNGELKLQVPNKTKTFAGDKVETAVNEYGIRDAISAQRLAFNPETSAARGFQVETPLGKYTVFMKDGQINKIIEAQEDVLAQLKKAKPDSAQAELLKKIEEKAKTIATGQGSFQFKTPTGNYAVILKDGKVDKVLTQHKDVYSELASAESNSTNGELMERFNKIAEELGKNSKEVDKSVFKGVTNIGYVNKNGDTTLKLTIAEYGSKTPQLKAINTLEQFDKNSTAVRAYEPSSAEEVFTGNLVNQTGWLNKKGVLADGLGVLECKENIAGAKCFFEGDKLVKIVRDKVEYSADSFEFKKFVKENEKAIEQFKKDVFVDKIADKIPTGALIGTV